MTTIYADNAATTQMSRAAIDAMLPYLETIYGNPSSLHSVGQQAAGALLSARDRIAKCLNASPREIYFTSGGSEADNQAIPLPRASANAKAKKAHHFDRVRAPRRAAHAQKLEKEGFAVELLPVGPIGTVTAQQVKDAIREDTCLGFRYVRQQRDRLHPADQRDRRRSAARRACCSTPTPCRPRDTCPLTSRRRTSTCCRSPRTSFTVRKAPACCTPVRGVFLTSLIEGGAQERGKRAGTENIPAIMGMAAALEDACAHLDENAKRVGALRDRLIDGLSKIPHSALNGDPVNRLPGNVSFCFEGVEGESLLLLLDAKGICASSGSACTSGSLDPSHVLLAIGRPHDVAHGSLRLSLCEWNTDEEIDRILDAVPEVVEYLRGMSPLWKDLVSGKKPFTL